MNCSIKRRIRESSKFAREEYLKLKNRNQDVNKHSFVLYLEAVSNVLNWINQG